MAVSAIATVMRSIGRHCVARPAVTALMALALGGVVAGGAMAVSPTVDSGIVFRGGINIVAFDLATTSARLVYSVPAGRKFMLTDLVIANNSDTNPATRQHIFHGAFGGCSAADIFRTAALSVPAADTVVVSFVTGLGFPSGTEICIQNRDGDAVTDWTIRGYLFD